MRRLWIPITIALTAGGLGALYLSRAQLPGGNAPVDPGSAVTDTDAAAPTASASVAASASAAPVVPAVASSASAPPEVADGPLPTTLEAQRAELVARMGVEFGLAEASLAEVRAILAASPSLGQGNPTVSRHPITRAECRKRRAAAGVSSDSHPRCGARNMVPVFNPGAGETAASARICIDQFEFPDIACDYPVVYARSNEAAALCHAVGKRICDAHEWEGACAGALRPPEVDYAWDKPRPYATWLHNKEREVRWAYGVKKDHTRCGTGSTKSPKCEAGGWTLCGSNTYPAGSFPACVSPFGAYDLHGNAAEHMNLPLAPEELASRGGSGATEMKGSWFIFQQKEAHEDDCRWRAKDWHPSKLADPGSHRNYHLGFRCCKDVAAPADAGPEAGAAATDGG